MKLSTQTLGRSQSGYNLVEILIALTIGGVLIGAVLMAIAGTGITGRKQDSQGQLSEEGQIALNILSSQLRVAGFWVPNAPLPALDPQGPMIRGCRNGFTNPAVAAFNNLTCVGGVGNDSIALRYDAREPGIIPADCLGASAAIPAAGLNAGWVDNRFYVQNNPSSGNPALYCRGNGGGTPQPLIENVEVLQLRYGVAPASAPPTRPVLFDLPTYSGETVRYVRADQLTANCIGAVATPNSWCAVTSVRECIVMRSGENAAEQISTPYTDCNGNLVTVADTRLRRAFSTTVSLRNRTAVP